MSAADIYLGNPNLKKANTQVEFTSENIEEFIKLPLWANPIPYGELTQKGCASAELSACPAVGYLTCPIPKLRFKRFMWR